MARQRRRTGHTIPRAVGAIGGPLRDGDPSTRSPDVVLGGTPPPREADTLGAGSDRRPRSLALVSRNLAQGRSVRAGPWTVGQHDRRAPTSASGATAGTVGWWEVLDVAWGAKIVKAVPPTKTHAGFIERRAAEADVARIGSPRMAARPGIRLPRTIPIGCRTRNSTTGVHSQMVSVLHDSGPTRSRSAPANSPDLTLSSTRRSCFAGAAPSGSRAIGRWDSTSVASVSTRPVGLRIPRSIWRPARTSTSGRTR